ncbi:MAG TPA: PEGA domain-containing protein [Kofleriaceae bacterium]|nr:PEGA domain-containing protein [Kofleriaceae bacterium]
MRAVTFLLVLAAAVPLGCRKPAAKAPAAPAAAPAEPPDTRPRLTVDVEPADAEILVDDVPVGTGTTVSSGVPLDPGLHRIVVRMEGYDTYRAEVEIEAEDESLRVQLEPAE